MKYPSLWITIPAGLFMALLLYAGLQANEPRFRITLEVDTPSGVKSGSSVMHASITESSGWGLPEASGVRSRLYGEAVFVDLGSGRSIIMLLDDGLTSLPGNLFQPKRFYNFQGQQSLRGIAEIPPGEVQLTYNFRTRLLPQLVTFTDITNPATAKIVEPTTEAFAAAFGSGHAFRRATLEMMRPGIWPFNQFALTWPRWLFGEPVTTGIEQRLPGLRDIDAWNRRARVKQSPSDSYGGGSGALIRNW
jgi:hypothetical protein